MLGVSAVQLLVQVFTCGRSGDGLQAALKAWSVQHLSAQVGFDPAS